MTSTIILNTSRIYKYGSAPIKWVEYFNALVKIVMMNGLKDGTLIKTCQRDLSVRWFFRSFGNLTII
jgi:hypothetical protein